MTIIIRVGTSSFAPCTLHYYPDQEHFAAGKWLHKLAHSYGRIRVFRAFAQGYPDHLMRAPEYPEGAYCALIDGEWP